VELTGFDVRAFLVEDLGDGDLTTESVVPENARLDATLLLKEEGVVCGLDVAEAIFRELDADVEFVRLAEDGQVARPSGLRVDHGVHLGQMIQVVIEPPRLAVGAHQFGVEALAADRIRAGAAE